MEKTKQKKHSNAGRKTRLTKAFTLKIRRLYLSGLNIQKIQEILEINPKTWETWYTSNYQGFRASFKEWRREKLLDQFEENLEEFSTMPTKIQVIEDSDDENGEQAVVVTDPRLVKIRFDATTYGLDTLGKEWYSKKLEFEDPEAARREDVDTLRKQVKNIINIQRQKYVSGHKDKMASAISKK